MLKNFSFVLLFVFLLGLYSFPFKAAESAGLDSPVYMDDMLLVDPMPQFLIKREKPYDEAKDPALRKGTENWEQPQSSFFLVPGVIAAIIALALFFNRD